MTGMPRLGIVADVRWDAGILAALPALVRGTGLDSIWRSNSSPTGPLPFRAAERLRVSASAQGVNVRTDAEVDEWRVGRVAGATQVARTILVPAWPGRSLLSLLTLYTAEGGPKERLVVEVPVSVGRTRAEAEARSTSWFAELGLPRDHGLFGTLEDCQEQVGALLSLGVRELRCVLPASDLPDVIAQLSAARIGTTGSGGPGDRRSAPPPPPAGWGGLRRRRP